MSKDNKIVVKTSTDIQDHGADQVNEPDEDKKADKDIGIHQDEKNHTTIVAEEENVVIEMGTYKDDTVSMLNLNFLRLISFTN